MSFASLDETLRLSSEGAGGLFAVSRTRPELGKVASTNDPAEVAWRRPTVVSPQRVAPENAMRRYLTTRAAFRAVSETALRSVALVA
jgi:hypothetical protein